MTTPRPVTSLRLSPATLPRLESLRLRLSDLGGRSLRNGDVIEALLNLADSALEKDLKSALAAIPD